MGGKDHSLEEPEPLVSLEACKNEPDKEEGRCSKGWEWALVAREQGESRCGWGRASVRERVLLSEVELIVGLRHSRGIRILC